MGMRIGTVNGASSFEAAAVGLASLRGIAIRARRFFSDLVAN
jgi:hypothetical protein